MTVSSWFRSDKPPLQETLKHLHPPTSTAVSVDERTRFSLLMLEHGEKPLKDWAVVAYSTPIQRDDSESADQSSKRPSKIQWQQHKKPKQSAPTRRRTELTSKESVPSAHMTKIEGRLHLCSRSLVLEPNSASRSLVRIPFARMEEPPGEFPTDAGYEPMCVQCISKRHIVIPAKNRPFESKHVTVQFRFTFLHSSPTQMVELSRTLFEILKASKTPGNTSAQDLEALLKQVQDRSFDRNNLLDIRESVLTNTLRCSILTPLQSKPGVVLVTSERIYFQAVAGDVQTWWLKDVAATARRYNGLRDSAVEIYFENQTSLLLALERRHDREQVLRLLPSTAVCFTDRSFVVQVLQAWNDQRISTFDYLLALNSAAGRSFHDLSRYPVFPWVLQDYSSATIDLKNPAIYRDFTKPVGALNKERLEYFQSRMSSLKDMGEDDVFLYGTHYSAPGYVLFFLLRSMPEHMLCLQNGKFDAPDRCFHSVETCYRCVLTNHADVKEIIPEFFHTRNFDFLMNCAGLPLGATQNGDRVNDVKLPPWARSARDFVKKQRAALESDHVRRNLPAWIDLIFGVNSRGEAALKAANLFHRTAYIGPTDLAQMATDQERIQAEMQATEFGIVPDQLFVSSSSGAVPEEVVSLEIGRASSLKEEREAWELLDKPSEPELVVTSSLLQKLPEKQKPSLAEVASFSEPDQTWSQHSQDTAQRQRQDIDTTSSSVLSNEHEASPRVSSPLTSQPLQEGKTSSDWEMKMLERQEIHSDGVSGCVLYIDNVEAKQSLLATTSLDGALKVHNVKFDGAADDQGKGGFTSTLSRWSRGGKGLQGDSQSEKLVEYRSHTSRDPLASLVLAQDGSGGSVAFAGGHDDVVLAYGINSACAVASVYSHRDAVTGLALIARTPFQNGQIWRENSTHILISGSWDATVKVWSATVAAGETVSVDREPLAELFDADSSIVCVSALSIPTGGLVISAGCADGSFCVWNVHNDGVQVVLHKEAARRASSCSVVQWVLWGGVLQMFAAFSTGKIASYSLVDGKVLERRSAVSVGVPVLSMVFAPEGFLLVGCADGGLRLIPLREGGYFEAKPTLWPAINHKSAPGICSVTYTKTTEGERCIACTGSEDGRVALFELKRVLS